MGFRDRADGVLLTKVSGFRKMWPFVIISRMEATVYSSFRIRLKNTLDWLERTNAGREDQITLFHVILAACVRMLALRPDLNRFVAGRRFYQRRTINISFVVRREKTEKSTETNLKLTFDPFSTLETVARQTEAAIQSTQKSRTSHDEKMSNVLTSTPRFMIQLLMRAGRILDYFGLLPASYIRKDSMFASAFVAHLGSIDLDAIYHPMFEWGNASFFLVVGKRKREPVQNELDEIRVEEVMNITFSQDQRITSGFHFAGAAALFIDLIENPEALMKKPENLPDPFIMT